MLRPQNDGFSLLGFVVFIALFILDPEMESPKTSEARNPELFFFNILCLDFCLVILNTFLAIFFEFSGRHA